MKRFFVAAAAALALAACGDQNSPLLVEPQAAGPRLATPPVGTRWSIFTSQTPAEFLDAAPGWEAGTRFTTSKPGRVVGFRFYRAPGETGVNTGKLWTNTGTLLASANFPSGSSGWQTVYLSSPVRISTNTIYRASVNTNTKMAKTGGGFYFDGPITSGPLRADGGYYGQPAGSMPGSESTSHFFADVIFEEDVPLPNLYVSQIRSGLANAYGQEIVEVIVCNNGPGAAGWSYTRFLHVVTPNSGGSYTARDVYLYTPAIASGACYNHQPTTNSPIASVNEYRVWADVDDNVYESSEFDNYRNAFWYR